MTTKLHGGFLHPFCSETSEMLTDRNRTGEGNLLYGLGWNQMFGNIGRHAEYEIEHARRQAGVSKTFCQLNATARCFFRGLDDKRATGGKCAGDLAHWR